MKKKWKSWESALPVLLFVGLFIFASISNIFDWDHFFTTAEAELRSWRIWGEPPVWSYQFCGGVTRIGDPQSFGLSPIFTAIILFGSFWGWKILIVFSAALGYFFLDKIRSEFFPKAEIHFARLMILSYIFSNYFMWHIHHGHMTELLHYWVLGLVYFFLRGTTGKLRWAEAGITALLSWAIFSAGFYHTTVFFGVPLALACVVYLGVLFVARVRQRSSMVAGTSRFLAGAAVGLLLASYKWLAVIKYQMLNPRGAGELPEKIGLTEILQNLFLPTIHYDYLGFITPHGDWGVWEQSVFSFLPWILVTFLVMKKWKKVRWGAISDLGIFALLFLFFSFLFYLGGDSYFYPFRFVNHFVFKDSVRVVPRFGHNLVLGSLFLILLWVPELPKLHKFLSKRWVYVLGIAAIALNFFSFSPTIYSNLKSAYFSSLAFNPVDHMRLVFSTRKRSMTQSFMYEPTLAGLAVLNCYNPISRDTVVAPEFSKRATFLEGKPVPFIKFDVQAGESCWNGTYFTSNHVIVDPSCPPGCFFLNSLSPADAAKYTRNPKTGMYCFGKEK